MSTTSSGSVVRASRYGNFGRPTTVTVNAFKLNWSRESVVFHYADVAVSITPEWPSKPGVEARISKQKGIEILQRLQTTIHPESFTRLGAFDGKGSLFSFVKYNLNGSNSRSFTVPLDSDTGVRKNQKKVKVVIAFVKTVNISLLKGLLTGTDGTSLFDGTSDASSCLNMLNLFVQAQPRRSANLYKGNSFYVPPTVWRDFERDIKPLRLWSGFFQSVRPAINEIIVNVDVTAGVVMPRQPLSQAAARFLGFENASDLRRLRTNVRLLRGALKGLKVCITIKNHPKRRARAVKDVVPDVGSVEFDGPEGITTVAEHFEKKYKIRIEKETLGVKFGQGELFPITVCEVEDQLYKPRLSPKQLTSLHRFMPSNPKERLKQIEDGWEKLGHAESEFLKGAQIGIDSRPMRVEARILDPRVIGFGPRDNEEPFEKLALHSNNAGTWDVMHKRLFRPMMVKDMMAVNFTGVRATNTMNDFIAELFDTMRERGESAVSNFREESDALAPYWTLVQENL
ncbi:hypothetical protein V5O48_001973 [Marasmius crinis-equi]|uniref:Argonaute linker 1 domain-containing protein n=1 Tax=Marasmius crinis-equi TaxID=585013 RepID=A0ABR3FXH9_9AGAR